MEHGSNTDDENLFHHLIRVSSVFHPWLNLGSDRRCGSENACYPRPRFVFKSCRRAKSRTIFVGHPMIENLKAKRIDAERDPKLVGLFPGSRAREVRKLMPILLGVIRALHEKRPDLHFEIAAASPALATVIRRDLAPSADSLGKVTVSVGQAAATMQRSAVGVVASGTATLEAAFFRLPFVLVYKVAVLTYLAGRMLIRVKHLGMPNVLADREIVPEFIQGKAQPSAIAAEVMTLLDDRARRERMLAVFEAVITKLGKGGANEVAARAILEAVSER